MRRYFYPADNATALESDAMWDLATLEESANCWYSIGPGNLNTGIRGAVVGTTKLAREIPDTVHNCRWHGVVASTLNPERPGSVITLSKKYVLCWEYSRSNSTKRPALGAGNVSEPSLMSQGGRVQEAVFA